MDEGLLGLQMLPSPWLAMGFFFDIPADVFSRAWVILLFFCRVFLTIGVFLAWRSKGAFVGVRFCTKAYPNSLG